MMALIELLQSNAAAFYGVVACLGLVVGSFLNVVIHRLPIMMENEWQASFEEMAAQPSGETATLATPDGSTETLNVGGEHDANSAEKFNLATPRSRCPNCNTQITWWQNLPVLSYVMLRGQCSGCAERISARYPIIEVVTMLLSLLVAVQFGATMQGVLGIIVTWFLISMTMIDFDHQLLPDSLTLPLMWIGLLASLVPIFTDVRSAVIGAAAGYLILWSIYQAFKIITGKEGMGYGDFKLLAALGALLGWQVLPMVILLSSLVGAIVGVTLIAITGRDKNIPIPFGPYLAAAGWLAMVWGDQLSAFYTGIFG